MPRLRRLELDADPVEQFRAWFEHAVEGADADPTAMTLATAASDGRPSARMVLLRGVDDAGGFRFYTGYESRKASELDANPHAALLLHWPWVGRQVRIEGAVSRLPASESDEYFDGRPRPSRLGAWASRQGAVLESRETLERELAEADARFAGDPVPRPPRWGGYRVSGDRFEFWQHGDARLHDRFRYTRGDGGWLIERLAP